MSSSDAEGIVRAFIEQGLNAHDASACRAVLAPDFSFHAGTATAGLDAYLEQREEGSSWSSDWQIQIQDVVANGDRIAVRATAGGTHRGVARTPFGDANPTGRRVETSWIAIYRVHEGRIAEAWSEADMVSIFRGLGALS